MKISLTRLTTIFAAAVLTVSSSPPKIGRGNYVYDENSITQNEKILKLFVRLAAHTANRLIKLKSKENPWKHALKIYKEEINVEPEKFSEPYRDEISHPISVISDEQARRSIIKEPSSDEFEKVTPEPSDAGINGEYSWVMINETGQQPGAEEYRPKDSEVSSIEEENWKNSAKDVTYDPASRLLEEQRARSENAEVVMDESNEEFPDDKESRSDSDDEMSDREVSEAGPTARTVISDVESGRAGEKLKYNDGARTDESGPLESITESSMVNGFTNQPSPESYVADEELKLLNSDSTITPVENDTEESTDEVESKKLIPEADFGRKVGVTEEEPNEDDDDDVELENRALFNFEKNNYVTNYVDKSTNMNRADTTVTNGGSGQHGRVVINQNAGSIPIERLEISGQMGKILNVGKKLSAGDVVVNQIAGSTGFGGIIGVGESTNENHATAKVGISDEKKAASASLGFEKSLGIGIGVGVGLNRESMGVKNFADQEQMSMSNLNGAAGARADAVFGLTSDIKKIKESNGVGIALQKKLALQVQPKHSSSSSLFGGILGTESHAKYSANMDSGNSMQGSVKLNEENSGIFHGSLAQEGQTNMNLGNSMQDSTMIREEHAGHFGGDLDAGGQTKSSTNMNLGSSMEGSLKVNEENDAGIPHGSLNKESQTKKSGNMNIENPTRDATMFKENHAGNYGSFYGVGSQMKGSANMNLQNSMQGSTKIGNENVAVHQSELNAQLAHGFVSKIHESVGKIREHEMHDLASAREAHHHSSTSQENLLKSVHSASGSLSGEADNAENKARQYNSAMMNQESGLNLGAQIGVALQHGTSLNSSGDEKSRVVGKDIYSSMHGEANSKGIRGGMKVEASKELSATGFGILNAKTNLIHKVLNPVGKFNGKLNLAAQVLASS